MVTSSQHKPIGTTDFQEGNRRATVRYRCTPPSPGRAFLANSSKSATAVVVDLSLGGIGLVVDCDLEPGTLVRIEMGNKGKETLIDLVAYVANATRLENGKWRYGCEWARPLAPEELQALR